MAMARQPSSVGRYPRLTDFIAGREKLLQAKVSHCAGGSQAIFSSFRAPTVTQVVRFGKNWVQLLVDSSQSVGRERREEGIVCGIVGIVARNAHVAPDILER